MQCISDYFYHTCTYPWITQNFVLLRFLEFIRKGFMLYFLLQLTFLIHYSVSKIHLHGAVALVHWYTEYQEINISQFINLFFCCWGYDVFIFHFHAQTMLLWFFGLISQDFFLSMYMPLGEKLLVCRVWIYSPLLDNDSLFSTASVGIHPLISIYVDFLFWCLMILNSIPVHLLLFLI